MLSWIYGRDLHGVYHDIIECLTAALEARDPYSEEHSQRVADMAFDLARRIGIKGAELEKIHIAAHLHDIGKIGVPDQILRKPGRLLPHERAAIQRHPEIGFNILAKSPRLKPIAQLVLYHHERWDGKGYPAGLKGETIPLGSRIIALCDAIDAMTSERPYRPALTWHRCWEEVAANKAIQFDAVLVEAVETLWTGWENKWSLKKAAW
ncbi:HD-GYP domain-containing protein [Moorella sp. Hama-1]|uniref:HD-GYP domain-containing protein n=1 Tax=Moorella sp. Hama-1 TaxID=2138101 RepID=UPI000D65D865|nr:HD-GYP domain-containing protein [Moorella sp. Hama-1]BCV21691.1 phosphohydrolase [Moorella sp. Hama-1]